MRLRISVKQPRVRNAVATQFEQTSFGTLTSMMNEPSVGWEAWSGTCLGIRQKGLVRACRL